MLLDKQNFETNLIALAVLFLKKIVKIKKGHCEAVSKGTENLDPSF